MTSGKPRFRAGTYGAALLLFLLAGCGERQEPESAASRLDRSSVAALSRAGPRVLLLVFDPTDCLACVTDMPAWLSMRRGAPGSVAILLTRPPSTSEATMFARYRIPIDGIIARNAISPRFPNGSAYLYRDGRLVASGSVNDTTLASNLQQQFAP